MSDIESESLPAHVHICQERYKSLETRLNNVERSQEKMELMIREIHQDLKSMTRQNHNQFDSIATRHYQKWDVAQIALISFLMGGIGVILSRFF